MQITLLAVAALGALAPLQEADDAPLHTPPTACLAYLEWRAPARTLELVERHPVLGPLAAEAAAGLGADASALGGLVDALRGADAERLERLFGAGLSLWLGFERLQPAVTVALVGGGEPQRAELLALAAELEGGAPAAAPLVEGEPVPLAGQLFALALGDDTFLSNSPTALAALASPPRGGRARRGPDALLDAHARRAGGSELFAWLDYGAVSALARLGGRRAAGGAVPGADLLESLAALPRDPRAQSLLGPGLTRLGQGRSWSLAARLAVDRLELRLAADGVAGPAPLAPTAAAPAPRAAGAHDAAHALLYRDLATLLAERATLFDGPELANVAMTVSQLELFLGGLTLEEDVLPSLSPWVEVVAREVPFARSPRPDLRLPAVALCFRVEGDPTIGEYLDAAFQGLVSVTNVQRTQDGELPLRLVLGREGEVGYTAARHPTPRPGDPVDAVYNFAPAAALVGDLWVLATHEELLVDLLDEVGASDAERTTTGAAVGERLTVRGDALAGLAAPQLDALALAQSLEDGVPFDEARADLEGLVWLLERTDAALTVGYESDAVVVGADLRFPRGGAR